MANSIRTSQSPDLEDESAVAPNQPATPIAVAAKKTSSPHQRSVRSAVLI
jgi:hypothetical protein